MQTVQSTVVYNQHLLQSNTVYVFRSLCRFQSTTINRLEKIPKSWRRKGKKICKTLLRHSPAAIEASLWIFPKDVDVRSLQASEVMAFLCARVDRDWVQLFGCWRSDTMLAICKFKLPPL
jgi:hypothetical protein